MIPPNLLLYYTTISTAAADDQTDYSSLLYVDMGSFFEVSNSRRLYVTVEDSPTLSGYSDKVIVLNYKDYKDASYVSSAIPTWSRFSINAPIPIKEYKVTALVNSPTHTRSITYDLSQPNPVVTHPGALYFDARGLDISSLVIDSLNLDQSNLYLYYDGPRSRYSNSYIAAIPEHSILLYFSGSLIYKRHTDQYAINSTWSDVTNNYTDSPIHPFGYAYLHLYVRSGINIYDDRLDINRVYLLGNYVYPSYTSQIYGLPDAKGYCVLGSNDSLPWTTVPGDDEIVNTLTMQAVPGSQTGYLPTVRIPEGPEFSNLEAVAWGLMAALSSTDLRLITLILKELIYQADKRGWFTINDGRLELSPLDPSSFGFENLIPTYPLADYKTYKETYSNSLLGYAICLALRKLYDTRPFAKYRLDGLYQDLEDKLRLLLKALQRFVAYSISPYSSLCSLKAQDGDYVYGLTSISASYYADIFLSSSLQIIYDLDIHVRYIPLFNQLYNLPFDINNPIYTDMYERDYSDVVIDGRPEFTYESTDNVERMEVYNRMLITSARLSWSLFHRDSRVTQRCLEQYEQLRLDLNEMRYTDPLPEDCLLTLAYLTINHRSHDNLEPYFETITLQGYFSSRGIRTFDAETNGRVSTYPEDLFELLESTFREIDYNAAPSASSLLLFPLYCFNNDYDVYQLTPFYSYALETRAFITKQLYTYRRMMPFGNHWFTSEKVEDTRSVIGSMLYAESYTLTRSYLAYRALRQSESIKDCFGDFVNHWFSSSLAVPIGLTSQSYKKSILQLFTKRFDSNRLTDMDAVFKEFFSDNYSLNYKPFPLFYRYRNIYSVSDTLDNYIEAEASNRGYYNPHEYFSMIYKVNEQGEWEKRRVGGFPVKEVPEGYSVLENADDFFSDIENRNPGNKIVVRDGPVYIIPFEKFTLSLDLEVKDDIPYLFEYLINSFFNAGLYIDTHFTSNNRT